MSMFVTDHSINRILGLGKFSLIIYWSQYLYPLSSWRLKLYAQVQSSHCLSGEAEVFIVRLYVLV